MQDAKVADKLERALDEKNWGPPMIFSTIDPRTIAKLANFSDIRGTVTLSVLKARAK